MDKYAQLKRFYHYQQLQVYMYDFMYVDPQKIPIEGNFPATQTSVLNHKKISTTGTVSTHWLVFSYICSEDYELDRNFYYAELENNQTTHPTIKLKFSLKYCGR